MHDDKNTNLSHSLAELDLFSESDLAIFSRYGIATLEQLLGATKGLTNTQLFDAFDNGERKLFNIRQLVGKLALKKFIDFKSDYPTGLILDDYD